MPSSGAGSALERWVLTLGCDFWICFFFLALEAVECGAKSAFRNSNVSVGSCGQFWTGEIFVKQNCLVRCLVAVRHQEGFFEWKGEVVKADFHLEVLTVCKPTLFMPVYHKNLKSTHSHVGGFYFYLEVITLNPSEMSRYVLL